MSTGQIMEISKPDKEECEYLNYDRDILCKLCIRCKSILRICYKNGKSEASCFRNKEIKELSPLLIRYHIDIATVLEVDDDEITGDLQKYLLTLNNKLKFKGNKNADAVDGIKESLAPVTDILRESFKENAKAIVKTFLIIVHNLVEENI